MIVDISVTILPFSSFALTVTPGNGGDGVHGGVGDSGTGIFAPVGVSTAGGKGADFDSKSSPSSGTADFNNGDADGGNGESTFTFCLIC